MSYGTILLSNRVRLVNADGNPGGSGRRPAMEISLFTPIAYEFCEFCEPP